MKVESRQLGEHARPGRRVLIVDDSPHFRSCARALLDAISFDGHGPALEVLAARSPLDVKVGVDLPERLPEPVKAVRVACGGGVIVEVAPLGAGDADAERRSGLRGLRDRVETLDGELLVYSLPGRGAAVRAEPPVRSASLGSLGWTP